MKLHPLLLAALMVLLLGSCRTTKDVPYLIDADKLPQSVLDAAARMKEPIVMAGDMLQINVSGPDADAVLPFNKTGYMTAAGNVNTTGMNSQDNSMYHYLVDNEGCIEFPLVGKLHVGGMTMSQVQELIASQIYPKYLTVLPTVEARIQNFRVFFLGEVGSPGVVRAPNGRLNLLEAISQAGDLTIFGKRDNIMIVRTNADGGRQVLRANINDPNIIVKPEYNLQQNDIIFVEPNATKTRSSWNMPPAATVALTSLGTIMSITTFIITLTK